MSADMKQPRSIGWKLEGVGFDYHYSQDRCLTRAADGHVDDLVVVAVAASVVDEADADAEDGDVDLLLDALVLAGRVGQAEAQVRVFREKLQKSENQ